MNEQVADTQELAVLLLGSLGLTAAEIVALENRHRGPGLTVAKVNGVYRRGSNVVKRLSDAYPVALVRRDLAMFGLDVVAETAGITAAELMEAVELTHDRPRLRFLMWAYEQARDPSLPLRRGQLRTLFPRQLDLPIVLLAGDGEVEFTLNRNERWSADQPRIVVEVWNTDNFSPGRDILRIGVRRFRALMGDQDRTRKVWNGKLARLSDVRYDHPDDRGRASLKITLQRTDYITHLATNYGFSEWPDDLSDKRTAEFNDPRNLRDSLFANALSVNVAYITSDNYLLVQKRNKDAVGHGYRTWQTSAAGFVSATRDEEEPVKIPKPSPFKAVKHETSEELGIRFGDEDVRFLGIVRDTENLEVGLVGYCRLDVGSRELAGRLRPGLMLSEAVQPGLDQGHEVLEVHPVLFEHETVFDFVLQHGGWPEWMPLGAASIVFALAASVDGGWDRLAQEWAAAKDRQLAKSRRQPRFAPRRHLSR